MKLTKDIALKMAVEVSGMCAQVEGTLMVCEDGTERSRLENARAALESLRDFYLKEAW